MITNDIQTLIPKLIRRVRREQSLSQEELANLAELDRTYISAIERGTRNITIKSLSNILRALRLDTDRFATELIVENKLSKMGDHS